MVYTITELEDLTGLNRRTIHYYTQQGVIPPPEGKGGAARYGEEHLLRLKLIKPLQESHLRLAGIREALEEMSLKEMQTLLNLASSEESWDTVSLQAWVGEPLAQYWFEVPEDSEPPRGRRSRFLRNLQRSPVPEETTWQRVPLAEGVELNIRSDADRRVRSAVVRLLRESEELRNLLT